MSTTPSSPSPLPSSPPGRVNHVAAVTSAYNTILRLEKKLVEEIRVRAPSTQAEKLELARPLMYCRIVGWFFHHVPTDFGLKNLVQEVASCEMDDQKLLDLGKLFYDHAIRVFRSAKGRTPTQSHQPSRPSFNNLADMIKSKLAEASLSHQTAKDKALVRDGFRCVVSGLYDYESIKAVAELKETAGPNHGETHCAHIIAESTNIALTPGHKKVDYAATAWAVLSRFGRQDILKELNGPNVHHLENVMTLHSDVHVRFDRLDLFMEPTNIENQYKVNSYEEICRAKYSRIVTLTSPDPAKLPLPHSEYLALHAACAKVAHLSGAAEYIDKMSKDLDGTFVLAEDGASAAVLDHAI